MMMVGRAEEAQETAMEGRMHIAGGNFEAATDAAQKVLGDLVALRVDGLATRLGDVLDMDEDAPNYLPTLDWVLEMVVSTLGEHRRADEEEE